MTAADGATPGPLLAIGQWGLYFRLVIVMVASLAVAFASEPTPLLPGVIAVAALMNLGLVLRWDRVCPWLMRHPFALLVDLVLTTGLVLLTGIDGPLLFYTLGTVFLGGLVYGQGGGLAYGMMVVSGYLLAAALRDPMSARPYGFQELVAIPVLLVLVAVGSAAIRRLLLERAEAERQTLREREDAAISADRARLARELHDSVAKTLHGISLQAAGLERHVRADPERAAREAATIGRTCARAARESRELLMSLRSQRLDVPLGLATTRLAEGWQRRTGVEVALDVPEVGRDVDPAVRHELLSITSEALRNIERHAEADQVTIELRLQDEELRLRIRDDGVGLPKDPDTVELADLGHYGLRGIVERAERVGGSAVITAAPDQGVTIDVRAPVADVIPALGQMDRTGGGVR